MHRPSQPGERSRERYLDPVDAAYIATVQDEELRETMLCTVTTFRRPDRLSVGDPMPDILFVRLDSGTEMRLPSLPPRPLVLFFGSYT
jgi:hypothetical protein